MSDKIQVTPETAPILQDAFQGLAQQGRVRVTPYNMFGERVLEGKLTCELQADRDVPLLLCMVGRHDPLGISIMPKGFIATKPGDVITWYELINSRSIRITYMMHRVGDGSRLFTLA